MFQMMLFVQASRAPRAPQSAALQLLCLLLLVTTLVGGLSRYGQVFG